ncbi:type III polyketide synthase [Blastomonas sp.]|uniref:type III polyketide synthase n=1 Tax=Blastomonas TaxID=150203 RepID=UPI00258F198B|nr:type III polyketide synthase [Blastomonas sp.]
MPSMIPVLPINSLAKVAGRGHLGAMLPRIQSIATGVPSFAITQHQVRDFVASALPQGLPPRIAAIYDSTGVNSRAIVQAPEEYLGPPDFGARNALYLAAGQQLLEEVANAALAKAGLAPDQIDAIVCVSSTGIATPSMASQMLNPMGFRADVMCLPLFGYGCAGGVLGLQVAGDLVRADPKRCVLLLTLELCSLAFRFGDLTKKAIIASTLFADGASAIVLTADGDGPALGHFAQHTWPDSRAMMGWDVDTLGLGLILSRDLPAFVASEFAPVVDGFLAQAGLEKAALTEPACHPGGRKVIDALEAYFDDLTGGLVQTRAVLADHGNMSSPTVHFVLERILAKGESGPLLLTALGPGFTGAMGVLHR